MGFPRNLHDPMGGLLKTGTMQHFSSLWLFEYQVFISYALPNALFSYRATPCREIPMGSLPGEAQLECYAKAHSFVFMISICMDILRGKIVLFGFSERFGFYFS